MVPGQDPLEQRALTEAQELISHSPKEAAEKLRVLVSKYKIAGNRILALEARRYQCFALTCDIRLEEARSMTLTLISEAMQAGNRRYLGIGEMYLGNIALEAGQWDIATEYYDEAMRIAREIDDVDLMARVSLNLGNAFLQLERFQDAFDLFFEGCENLDRGQSPWGLAMASYNCVYAQLRLADPQDKQKLKELEQMLAEAEALAQDIPTTRELLTLSRAFWHSMAHDANSGLKKLAEFEENHWHEASAFAKVNLLELRELILEREERWQEMVESCDKTLEHIGEQGNNVRLDRSLQRAARANAKLGNFKQAYQLLQQSINSNRAHRTALAEQRTQVLQVKLEVEANRFEQEVLRMRNKLLVEKNQVLEQEAYIDRLSGVLNRRGIEEKLNEVIQQLRTTPFGIALLDIDFFKRINDKFGHGIGDEVIRQFAHILQTSQAEPEYVGRWGGEEFLVTLETGDDLEIRKRCQQIIEEISQFDWNSIANGLKVTSSLGIAVWQPGADVYSVIDLADQRLYYVKAHGRNGWQFESEPKAA